jgi:riboflavin biosynthesis pyrimidine reductase
VRQLLPEVIDDVDPVALYAADARPAPPGRPWVLVNMISSIDGATTVDGVSGPLGGPADKRVFGAVRAVADAILVGAGTVRAEGYGPPRRRGDGARPRVAVLTRSAELDPGLRLFAEADPADPPPVVLTAASAPPARVDPLREVAEVVVAGARSVDLALALAALADRGVGVVLAEGGPTVNGQLVAAGVVDEWCASVSPSLVSGMSSRAAHGPAPAGGSQRMRLDRLLVEDDLCFARYVRLDSSVISAAKSDRSSNPL